MGSPDSRYAGKAWDEARLGRTRMDGIDELSIAGATKVAEVRGTEVREFEILPKDADLSSSPLSALEGGSPQDNALAIQELLDGQEGPFRDCVLLNAAAGLHVLGKANSLKDGVTAAATAIDSGKARSTLKTLAAISNGRDWHQ